MAEVETLAKLTISIWFACWDPAWRTPPIARLRVPCPMGLCMCLSSSMLKAGATTSRSTRVVVSKLPSKLHEASNTCRRIVRSKSFIWTCKPSAWRHWSGQSWRPLGCRGGFRVERRASLRWDDTKGENSGTIKHQKVDSMTQPSPRIPMSSAMVSCYSSCCVDGKKLYTVTLCPRCS